MRIVRHVGGGACPSCGTENPEQGSVLHVVRGDAVAELSELRHREPAGRQVLHRVRHGARGRRCGRGGAAIAGDAAAPLSTRGSGPSAPPAQPEALFGGQLPGVAAPAWGSPGAGALPEERRKATVLFADLSGYTAIAERMDPEAVKSIVDRALRRLGQEVVRYGGSVDKYIGDNVMAVFGAPISHEDDPERAVRAGLAMQAAMEEINKDMAGVAAEAAGANFSLRVGINSGEVLAGQVGDGYTVMGDAVNVAARLQAAATPGSVTVGEITHRLTRGAIEY